MTYLFPPLVLGSTTLIFDHKIAQTDSTPLNYPPPSQLPSILFSTQNDRPFALFASLIPSLSTTPSKTDLNPDPICAQNFPTSRYWGRETSIYILYQKIQAPIEQNLYKPTLHYTPTQADTDTGG